MTPEEFLREQQRDLETKADEIRAEDELRRFHRIWQKQMMETYLAGANGSVLFTHREA